MKRQLVYALIVLILFPLFYMGLSLSPWSVELFENGNSQFFPKFWISVIVLHWATLLLVLRFLNSENKTLRDIGYNLNKRKTSILILSYFVVAILLLCFVEFSIKQVNLDEEKLNQLGNFYPKTMTDRIIFILVVFSAGFCEEIIYRGYLITNITDLGLNKYLAWIPAAISFVFMHGIIGFTQFWFYFAAAFIFSAIYIFSKRLWPAIVVHLLFDLSAMMAIFNAVK
ncbi:CPBP family intramembrane glutamic endopeptidase [Sphingobacterium hungaricum]